MKTSRSAYSHPTEPAQRKTFRPVLAALIVLFLVVVGAGVWAVDRYGPRFGIYLTTPSTEEYADAALGFLQNGYYASGPEWDAVRSDLTEQSLSAGEFADLHEEIERATAVAGGKHSFFLTPHQAGRYAADSTAEYESPTVSTEGGVTTVQLPPLGEVSPELRQNYAQVAADEVAAAAPASCGWVIDLRGNTGGDMHPMLAGISALLPNGTALTLQARGGYTAAVDITDDGVTVNSTDTSVDQHHKITGVPIAVLQDERTGSSGEAVLTAFRGLPGVESFGAPSAGYTSGNSIHRLYDGAVLGVTGSVYVDRNGIALNEEPIPPDHPADDPAEKAREWLSARGCQ